MGSSKRLECDAGAASWIANMLAVASASQKDSLNFFILVLLFFWISGTLKGPWFNNLGSHISKNAAIHAPGLKDQAVLLTQAFAPPTKWPNDHRIKDKVICFDNKTAFRNRRMELEKKAMSPLLRAHPVCSGQQGFAVLHQYPGRVRRSHLPQPLRLGVENIKVTERFGNAPC